MEVDAAIPEVTSPKTPKRQKNEDPSKSVSKAKKSRMYSVKEFRKKLSSNEKIGALQEFLAIIKNTSVHDYVFDYLTNGGNCLELLQTLEGDSAIPPTLVFDLVTQLLLRINANYGQFYNSAHESCKYLINNYLPLIYKMLGLSSSKEERKVCLKLLTAMAALSHTLAKDILLNVKFHSANIELLTKHTGEINSVRDCFVQFLTAFLVDSDVHTLSILLEKSGLLTGIISGLQYDVADTVCLVVAAMKNHILENSAVTKTTKMHVFNTSVVKDIVNLYNWKGPEGLKALDKNNRTVFEVDKIAKSKVSECVHDFLLVLCTSHKYGVIFKDPLVGLGRKNQNSLMYTVLESLDRPWEHSYASELVLKICRSCPDLIPKMWINLKPFLEPRVTEKWINAMDFAKRLLNEVEPNCIEHCVKDLSTQQLALIIEFTVTPFPIIKVLNIENNANDKTIMLHIIALFQEMLDKVNNYVSFVSKWTSIESYVKILQHISLHISRNFPNAHFLLENWKRHYLMEEDDANALVNNKQTSSVLEVILNILILYKNLASQLLNNLTSSSLDLKHILLKLCEYSGDEPKHQERLQVKIISIFVDIDPSYFLPKTEAFCFIIPLLLKIFHEEKSKEVQSVLHNLLKNTGIFESSLYEIDIWLNGIFNFRILTDDFANQFVQFVKNTSENILEYQKEFTEEEENFDEEDQYIIDILLNNSESSEDIDDISRPVKHRRLSPLIIGFLKYLQENGVSKTMKKYSEFVLLHLFHYQTSQKSLCSIISRFEDQLPPHVVTYIKDWSHGSCDILTKIKGNLGVFVFLSEIFLSSTIDEAYLNMRPYPDYLIDVLRMFTCYFSVLVETDIIGESHSKNWRFLIEYMRKNDVLNETCLEVILANPKIIKYFDITKFNKHFKICTRTVFELIRDLGTSYDIEAYTTIYSSRVFKSIEKILKKPKKYLNNEDIAEFLKVFPLGYRDCIKGITQASHLLNENTEITSIGSVLDILTYSFDRVLFLCNKNPDYRPLDKSLVSQITSCLVILNRENKDCSDLFKTLKSYLELFPHSIPYIDKNLFSSILKLSKYGKESADLAVVLLEKDLRLAKEIEAHIMNVVDKKGVILPLTHVLVNSGTPDDVLKTIYEQLEPSILKAMQKPQKVGQHFLKNYDIGALVHKFMPAEKYRYLADKAQKFEVTEVFHVRLMDVCYGKIINGSDITVKQATSIIMTFIHFEITILKKLTNSDEDIVKINDVSTIFGDMLHKLSLKLSNEKLAQIATNESFKTFCKLSLKYGVSGQHILLKVLRNLVILLKDSLEKDDAGLLLEMLLSHSEFLNVVLGERSDTKLEVLKLFLTICENWNDLMEKNHLAVILSAYRAMVTRCDRTVLALLKLYGSKAEQTRFYDFKPFLWGRAAATHYSVRTKIDSALTRQPKISDILGMIKEELVHSTIKNYPQKESLLKDGEELDEDIQCYDLKFILPLFSHILAPEQQVKTYVFSRSGALSLTVVGLSSQDKQVRQAASHILSRYHFHLEARQTGKDNLLWIRFVDALCKGITLLPDFRLNNFASTFFARMALILTNPKHVMFTQLSSYLSAKQDLDLSTVPELYTLLFSCDVNFKEHRNFILEVLRDGLRTERDFVDFLKSMGFKLFSELFSSCLSDLDSKLLILDILHAACKITIGAKILCENYSLLPQLHTLTLQILRENRLQTSIFPKLLQVFLELVKIMQDHYTNFVVADACCKILTSEGFLLLRDNAVQIVYEVLYNTLTNGSINISKVGHWENVLNMLLRTSNDKFCIYLKNFGCQFVNETTPSLQVRDKYYFLRKLVLFCCRKIGETM